MSWLERRRARRAEEDELVREFNENPPPVRHVGWGPARFTRREKIRWTLIHRRIMTEMSHVHHLEHVPTVDSGECSLCGVPWPCEFATEGNIRKYS